MNRLLYRLDGAKRDFSAHGENLVSSVLASLDGKKFNDAESLIRFHDALLFFRAYPPSVRIQKQVAAILQTFARRVTQLRAADADLAPLDDPEVSGITGTSVTSNFSYAIVCWLAAKYPAQLSIDWDWFEEEERFGATMPRCLPLLEEEAMVEAHVPYGDYLRAAKGRANEVVWLIQRFEALRLPPKEKAEAYDALKIHVRWQFGARASRTAMKLATRKIFFHHRPLIARREVSLVEELTGPPVQVERVTPKLGEKILEMARETSAVRYRELHGFTFGDSRRVLKAYLGRGLEVFVFGVPPQNRLPLRAYHAALIFKNGVPVGYFEGLSIFERMESGFNLYYTFREGETAWLYARVLRLMRQLFGVTVFSIDPYQVGHENEEGIESGAFWFYRKLGFRPVRQDLMKLTLAEERRLAADSKRRTTARTLRQLASGPMLFELPEERAAAGKGDWDRFQIRNPGLAVQRRMAGKFDGDAQSIREHSVDFVVSALGLRIRDWSEGERMALGNFALLLAMMPIESWDRSDRQAAARIIQAKGRDDESIYLKLMQKHSRLRAAMIRLGS
ncbi:MAG: hypothetical protein QOK48_3343 [Blastocatellia bacterium]|jgi:hypothetical protein|nr:hypothetical protein [Blastocatellia bacterium]